MVQSKKILQFNFVEHYFLNKKETVSSFYKRKIQKAFSVEQIHKNKILVVCGNRRKTDGFDGIITSEKVWLNIRTADCLPIFFLDPVGKAIAAIHAGWRGLSLDIIKACISQMKKNGSFAQDMIAVIGPHIGVCCYNVSNERVELFAKKMHKEKEEVAQFQSGEWFLNLDRIARLQIKKEGIRETNIDSLSLCTVCNLLYSSSRREGKSCQRMMNVIRIRG